MVVLQNCNPCFCGHWS